MSRKTLERLAPPVALAFVIGTLGVTGHFGSGDHLASSPANADAGDGITRTQLESWPLAHTDLVTVTAGQGAEAIAKEVNPEVFEGPDVNTETGVNLTTSVTAQANGGLLQTGQQVKVADIHPNIPPADPNDSNIQPAG